MEVRVSIPRKRTTTDDTECDNTLSVQHHSAESDKSEVETSVIDPAKRESNETVK